METEAELGRVVEGARLSVEGVMVTEVGLGEVVWELDAIGEREDLCFLRLVA